MKADISSMATEIRAKEALSLSLKKVRSGAEEERKTRARREERSD